MADLNARHGHLRGRDLLEVAIGDIFPGRIALSSSFGADAAVLLAEKLGLPGLRAFTAVQSG